MRKFMIVFLCLFVIHPTTLLADTITGQVANLRPQTNLQFTVEPLPRKVDIVVDHEMIDLSRTEIQSLIDAELKPRLVDMDVNITYLKPEGYTRDPLFLGDLVIRSDGRVYYNPDASDWLSISVPNNAKLIDKAGTLLLDDRTNLYHIVRIGYSYSIEHLLSDTGLVKILTGGKSIYGIDRDGQLHHIEHYLGSSSIRIYHIEGFSDIVDAAGDGRNNVLAVDRYGDVWVKGYSNFSNPDRSSNYHIVRKLDSLSNVKSVEVVYGTRDRNGFDSDSGFALTYDGDLYSWGQGYLGRKGGSGIQKIEVGEPVKYIEFADDGVGSHMPILADSGKLYYLLSDRINDSRQDHVQMAHVGGYYYKNRFVLYDDGTLSPVLRSPNNRDHHIFAGYMHGGVFSRFGTINVWGGEDYDEERIDLPTLPKGEIMKDVHISQDLDGYGLIMIMESGKVYYSGRTQIGRDFYNTGLAFLYSEMSDIDSMYQGDKLYAIDKRGNLYVKNSSWNQIPIQSVKQVVSSKPNREPYSLAVDDQGDLWVWGMAGLWSLDAPSNEYGMITIPTKINLPFKIEQITALRGLVVALDTNGEVWTWGTSSDLSLGYQGVYSSSTPLKLENLPKIRKLSVPIYDHYTPAILMLGHDGHIYGWGINIDGIITGIENNQTTSLYSYDTPYKNTMISSVEDMAMGYEFVVAKNRNGNVFTWGDNYLGKLGRNSSASRIAAPGGISRNHYPSSPLQLYSGSLSERLKISWRAGAERYYVHITDFMDKELESFHRRTKIMTELVNQNISYIGFTSQNQDVMNSLVRSLDSRGKVVTRTDNLNVNVRHIGEYISRKQPMDIVFHLGQSEHDDLRSVETLLTERLVPVLDQYGIELRLTVTDGVRVPEDRIYYLNGSYQIYSFDPRTEQRTRLVTRNTIGAMVHYSGDLFYMERGTRNVYRYDVIDRRETLYYTFDEEIASGEFVVDDQGRVFYISKDRKYVKYYSPDSRKIEVHSETRNSFRELRLGGNGSIMYRDHDDQYREYIAYPKMTEYYVGEAVLNESGCIFYSYGLIRTTAITCGRMAGDLWPTGLANGDEGMFIYLHEAMYDSNIYLRAYDQESNTSRTFYQFSRNNDYEGLTSTPDGRYYFNLQGQTHYYNWRTNELGMMNIKIADRNQIIPYSFINVDTRRLSKISLTDGLQQALWRTDTDAYYVYLNDGTISGLTTIEDTLREDKVTFVGLGRNTNKTQIENFTKSIGEGTYIDNTNLNESISELVSYLIQHAGLPKYDTDSEKVILEYHEDTGSYQSGSLVFDAGYADMENDPKIKERWVFRHDHTYYENDMGQLPEHNTSRTAPITTLTRTGKYEISYEAGDRPTPDPRFAEYERWSNLARLDIYAHRRPIADFVVEVSPTQSTDMYSLALTDQSYDLDRQSEVNRGIIERQWKWKTYSESDWTPGMPPSTISSREIYMISLRVKDEDGAWSDEKVMVLTANEHNNAPVAKFTVTSTLVNNQEYTIVDQSFDPDGDPIAEQVWQVHKDGVNLYTENARPTAATLRARASSKSVSPYGTYTMTLMVRDDPSKGSPLWSDPYQQTFTIIENKPPTPGFNWTPTSLVQGDTVQIRHAVHDPEEETLRIRYRVTAPNGTVSYYPSSTGWYSVSQANYTGNAFTISHLLGGNYTVLQTVMDAYSTKTLTKTISVIANRPPVANFTWSPTTIWEGDTVNFTNISTDPDGDTLTYTWVIRDPSGSEYRSGQQHVNRRFTRTGAHTVQLTVSDGRLTSQKTVTIHVKELTLTADVRHTELWRRYHQEAGHEIEKNPKDFYTGETLLLEASVSPTSVRSLTATLIANSRKGTPLHVTTELRAAGAGSYRYVAEMYDERFSSLDDAIAEGEYTIRFYVTYTNGTQKTTDVPIRIIGHMLETVGVHRRQ